MDTVCVTSQVSKGGTHFKYKNQNHHLKKSEIDDVSTKPE